MSCSENRRPALLGVVIKYGFTGMRGFVESLVAHGMLPAVCAEECRAPFAVSLFTNVLFRSADDVLPPRGGTILPSCAAPGFAGMRTPLPHAGVVLDSGAHRHLFALRELQIGLAAIWSVALGIILGMAAGKNNTGK
ncbi:MAG: hypothetical protein IPP94_06175 [Ignavibacteria bacterium]|nr:hypothetical protein [Ignavibacteria bacterium]